MCLTASMTSMINNSSNNVPIIYLYQLIDSSCCLTLLRLRVYLLTEATDSNCEDMFHSQPPKHWLRFLYHICRQHMGAVSAVALQPEGFSVQIV